MTAIPLERLIEAARAEPTPQRLRAVLRGLERTGLEPRPAPPSRLAPDEAAALDAIDLVLDVSCGADTAIASELDDDAARTRLVLASGRALELATDADQRLSATALVDLEGATHALATRVKPEASPLGALLQAVVHGDLAGMPLWSQALRGELAEAPDAPSWPWVDQTTRECLDLAQLRDEASLHALAVTLRRPPRMRRGAPPVAPEAQPGELLALRGIEAVLDVVRGRDRVVAIDGGDLATMTLASGLRCELSVGSTPVWLERLVWPDGRELQLSAPAPAQRPLLYLLNRPVNDMLDLLPGWREPCALAIELVDGGHWRVADAP